MTIEEVGRCSVLETELRAMLVALRNKHGSEVKQNNGALIIVGVPVGYVLPTLISKEFDWSISVLFEQNIVCLKIEPWDASNQKQRDANKAISRVLGDES